MVQAVDDLRVVARIGVLAHPEIGPKGDLGQLEKALRYYRQCKVDAVVLTGRITKDGTSRTSPELENLWQKVFPEGKTRLITEDGRQLVNGFAFAVSSKRPAGACDLPTFYAGRKLPLTDELCFYPRASLAICAGSLRGIEVPETIVDKALRAAASKAAQGLLVSAYQNRTVIRRLDFTQSVPVDADEAWRVRKSRLVYAEDVDAPWEIVSGTVAELASAAPQFWADTRLCVLPGMRDNAPVCTVKWPTVTRRGTGVRARWYEVDVAYADAPERSQVHRTVLSHGFFLSEMRDLNGVTSIFTMQDLPKGDARHSAVVFSVTPVGPTGKRGKPLVSEPLALVRRGGL